MPYHKFAVKIDSQKNLEIRYILLKLTNVMTNLTNLTDLTTKITGDKLAKLDKLDNQIQRRTSAAVNQMMRSLFESMNHVCHHMCQVVHVMIAQILECYELHVFEIIHSC